MFISSKEIHNLQESLIECINKDTISYVVIKIVNYSDSLTNILHDLHVYNDCASIGKEKLITFGGTKLKISLNMKPLRVYLVCYQEINNLFEYQFIHQRFVVTNTNVFCNSLVIPPYIYLAAQDKKNSEMGQ